MTDLVFYDGTCGLCHRAVRFFLRRDRAGTAFLFSPLGGERFRSTIGELRDLPDSIVVRTAAGETLVRSAAMIHLLERLGGGWRFLATIAAIVPRPVRDFLYDRVASVRYRVFGREQAACPTLPPELRSRFVP